MRTTIAAYNEYHKAAENYEIIADKAHEAMKYVIRVIFGLIMRQNIAGQTAKNMAAFLSEMSSTLKSTFKNQVSHAASLCEKYVLAIDAADREKYSGAGAELDTPVYAFETVEQSFSNAPLLIKLDKNQMIACINALKSGPVKDIEDCITCVNKIQFIESEGAVRDQSEVVRNRVADSLGALSEIVNALIAYLESVVSTMEEADTAGSRLFLS